MHDDVIDLFLDGARAVESAVASPEVGRAWDQPSVLDDQLVSGLCGHLARGGVWVVSEYLERGHPAPPVDFETATEYFAAFAEVPPELHRGSRLRSAEIGAGGQAEVSRRLGERIEALERELRVSDPAALVGVISGKVMRVRDYLETRLVEQAVHLDDLARSVGTQAFPYPEAGRDLAIALGLALAAGKAGRAGLLRALYREGFAGQAFPVM
jgi:hypothetical protein